MKSKSLLTRVIFTACTVLLVLAASGLAAAQGAKGHSISLQKGFDSPQAAADALIQAASDYDTQALLAILGPDSHDLITTGDPVQDKNRAAEFAAKAKEKNTVALSSKSSKWAILSVGEEQWPVPLPIVKRGGKWYFDTRKGRDNILLRRIGANELDAITICRGYVDAQHEYAATIHDDSGVNQYAQRIISTPGKHDGLVWREPDGALAGPISEGIAKAIEQGYTGKDEPYHGYFFKVLKGQGPAARLGKLDYVIQGAMIGGFALIAAPAEYRVTGVKSFMVSQDGVVYEKDLGPDTLKIFKSMELYDPDRTWAATTDRWPVEAAVISK